MSSRFLISRSRSCEHPHRREGRTLPVSWQEIPARISRGAIAKVEEKWQGLINLKELIDHAVIERAGSNP